MGGDLEARRVASLRKGMGDSGQSARHKGQQRCRSPGNMREHRGVWVEDDGRDGDTRAWTVRESRDSRAPASLSKVGNSRGGWGRGGDLKRRPQVQRWFVDLQAIQKM